MATLRVPRLDARIWGRDVWAAIEAMYSPQGPATCVVDDGEQVARAIARSLPCDACSECAVKFVAENRDRFSPSAVLSGDSLLAWQTLRDRVAVKVGSRPPLCSDPADPKRGASFLALYASCEDCSFFNNLSVANWKQIKRLS